MIGIILYFLVLQSLKIVVIMNDCSTTKTLVLILGLNLLYVLLFCPEWDNMSGRLMKQNRNVIAPFLLPDLAILLRYVVCYFIRESGLCRKKRPEMVKKI